MTWRCKCNGAANLPPTYSITEIDLSQILHSYVI